MSFNLTTLRLISYMVMSCLLSDCYHPPFNHFKPDNRMGRETVAVGAIGGFAGVVATGALSGTLVGAAIGGSVGAIHSIYKDSKPALIRQLKRQDVQYVQYGDTMTLIVPTDKYFMFMSPRLNELCYPGLTNIVRLLKLYPQSPVYVAGFTDNVGSHHHKKLLSQAQAETMMTYLWANGIQSIRLTPEGYGDKNAVSDNNIVHGSAQNRRIEIQWFNGLTPKTQSQALAIK